MRFGRCVQEGTRGSDGSANAHQVSPSPRGPKRRVAVLPWLALLLVACAVGAQGCGSGADDSTADSGLPDSGGPDVTTKNDTGAGSSSSSSSGGQDATMGKDGTGADTSAPDSAQTDATTSDGAGGDAPSSDAPSSSDGPTADGSNVSDASEAGLPCIIDGGDASGDCCPDDPFKTQPGVCGCGVSDVDSDGDGTPDCLDACPGDKLKITPGICGCGNSDGDSDHDGAIDCLDACPHDPLKIATPGVCGCGFPDTTPACLEHRYSFKDGTADAGVVVDAAAPDGGSSGPGTIVSDSIGHADGTAINVLLQGAGSLTLAGGPSQQYVQLPSGIVSALGNNVTIEAFVTWTGQGGAWQRFFDFGSNAGGAGTNFLFSSPAGGPSVFLATLNDGVVTEIDGPGLFPFSDGLIHEMAWTISTSFVPFPLPDAGVPDAGDAGDAGPAPGPGTSTVSLYLDGVLKVSASTTNKVTDLADVSNWLGRSQFAADPYLQATYYEFRMYSMTRTAAQLVLSTQAGHNVAPTQ